MFAVVRLDSFVFAFVHRLGGKMFVFVRLCSAFTAFVRQKTPACFAAGRRRSPPTSPTPREHWVWNLDIFWSLDVGAWDFRPAGDGFMGRGRCFEMKKQTGKGTDPSPAACTALANPRHPIPALL